MKPLITIVMPIYNVGKYIENSVKSICEQSFKNLELILVDDGSKDNSIDLAKGVLNNYQIYYKIIHQENKGLSGARNTGIKNAKGDWVICIDSDDTIHPNTFSILEKYIKDDSIDAIAFDFSRVETAPSSFKNIQDEKIKKYSQKDFAYNFFVRNLKLAVPTILLRKEKYINENLYYDEECKFSEDQIFIWKLIKNINNLCFVNEKMYFYLDRPGSIMTSSSIEKILTGYDKIKKISIDMSKDSLNYGFDSELILSRWVFGTLHSSAKQMNFIDFKRLYNILNKENCLKNLNKYPVKKIYLISSIKNINLKLFYYILKNI